MKRYALLAAVVMVLAALVPAGLAAEPNGKGLFREHPSSCSGAVTWNDKVTLVPGSGATFWVNGYHLAIQRAEITDGTTGKMTLYTFGQKRGQTGGGIVRCEGDFPGYHVVSYSVVVP